MPDAWCQKCDRFYEWPWAKGRTVKDYPCPACKGPGLPAPRKEEYERDRKRLKAWTDGAK